MCSEFVELAGNCVIDNPNVLVGMIAFAIILAVPMATMVGVIILITDKG